MQLIRALESFVHDFHREESAQISFLAVAGIVCFVGLLSMVINTNDVITERVHMQDVALFKEGFVASDEIKLMAEDGDNSGLLVSWVFGE